ncbi:MAG: hypothetical protein ACFFEF_17900 [Candidatus Thorarchaeota archaeon]
MTPSSRKNYTIRDVIETFHESNFGPESLEVFLDIIEEEWILCEDRKGGINTVVSELGSLVGFLRSRLIPMATFGYDLGSEKDPRETFDSFITANISQDTYSHVILHTGNLTIRQSLQSIAMHS